LLKVAFICVHNSCRSQMAETIAKEMGKDVFEAFSAGTQLKNQINSDAVRIMKSLGYGDITKVQRPKLLQELPEIDIVITMGCNVACPMIKCKYREDWGLQDPTEKSDEEFLKIVEQIKAKMNNLIARINNKEL
jgi:arsenate reductase